MLNMTETGVDSDRPPVLLAHGLFGSGRNLGGLARRLGESRRVISVDMRNHGDSFHDSDHGYPALAADLAEIIAARGGTADVLGHSMGGKAAMVLALTRPETVRRLVVMDIAPFAYDHSQTELIDAMQAVDLSGLHLRSEADARLAEQVADLGVRAFLLQSLDLNAQPARWKLNLAALRDQMPLITGWPEMPKATFPGPALFLAGADSDYCGTAQVHAIRKYFPEAQIRIVEGAGHWLHADRPAEVAEAVARFLD
ncbi:alpha/beta fold hydrolase [Paracoccus aminovorans]|uniref:alpha/beta fold hydrolase n=1 Tax=Paracoccus aminovorans TaxID=34004 RepID=UPI002B259BA7|nr:alpha/beta fold hydrolase [Paracoccus aminovorans]